MVKKRRRAKTQGSTAHAGSKSVGFRLGDHGFFFLVAAAMVAVFLAPLLFGDGYFWGSGTDIRTYQFPLRRFAFTWLRQGVWPLWNPFLFSGVPFQTGVHNLAYPGTLFGLLFPTGGEILATLYLHLLLALAFTAMLLRAFDHSRLASLLGGTMFALGGFSVAHMYAGHVDIITALAYVPLLLLTFEWACRRRGLGWTLLAACSLALMVSTGHLQMVYLAMFGLILFTAIRVVLGSSVAVGPLDWRNPLAREESLRRDAHREDEPLSPVALCPVSPADRLRDAGGCLVRLAAMCSGAASMTLHQLLPTLTSTGLSNRSAEASYEFAVQSGVPKWNWATYLAPDVFGGTAAMPFFASWSAWEGQAYLGAALLVLTAAAVTVHRPRRWVPWVVVIAVATGLAMGDHAPFLKGYYYLDPLVGRFRAPSRFVLPVSLFGAWLSAAGLDAWLRLRPEGADRRRMLFGVLAVVGTAGLLTLLVLGSSDGGWLQQTVAAVASEKKVAAMGQLGTPAALVAHVHKEIGWAFALVALNGLLLLSPFLWPRQRPRAGALLFGLLLADLMVFALPKLTTRPESAFELPPESVAALRELNSSYPRILTHGSLRAINDGAAFGISHFGGYDILIDKRYNRAVNLASGYPEDRQIMMMTAMNDGPFWWGQGVRYMVLPAPLERLSRGYRHRFAAFRQIRKAGGLYLYENPKALPRSFVVRAVRRVSSEEAAHRIMTGTRAPLGAALLWDDSSHGEVPDSLTEFLHRPEVLPEEKVEIVSLTPNEVRLRVDLQTPGVVVLTDAPHPGWRASVDGNPTPLYSVNGDLHRAVKVSGGKHEIRFAYFPASLKLGLSVSVPAWLLALGYVGWGVKRRRRRREPKK